ncbi:hypothetical protein BY996DRAFT_6414830 [Phakopsora pachyrhizi]|uniref:Ribosomal protein S16 n=1 Tax=Phakopsora pachyrhizi TaxID=170000 RepID=A0AAV0AEZ1_PHAPC|nr:hypothetical protein BY996DRAFT_6414830 [Phakopsora pachyrhizi]CAH7666673.1 hypothetical protein PPACK8108_LOCUS1023 [Phakopsora pachyrhizi]
MVVRIRLARSGPRNHPLFHLVAIQAPKRRDAKPLEKLGVFTPHPILRVKPPSVVDLVHSLKLAKTIKDPDSLKKLEDGLAEGGVRSLRKDIRWDVDRIRYWLGVGAQPSESVLRLFRVGGLINQPEDVELLRKKTSLPGTKPKMPLRFIVATTRRGPRGMLSRFRRRGLLPQGTKFLPDGRLQLPGVITKTGEPITLETQEIQDALEKGARIVQSTPHRILPAKWKHPPVLPNQTTPPKPKPDPGWWKVKRRRRAAALALTDQLPKPLTDINE